MKGFRIIKTKQGENDIRRDIDILNFVYDSEVVKNNIEARCQVIQGELAYNTMLGISLKSTKETKDLDISSIINTTKGVKEIKTFGSNLLNSGYSTQVNVVTIYKDVMEVQI